MKVALVHDYLIQDGGAERVLLEFHRLFPRAPIFTLFYDKKQSHPEFQHAKIITSKLNELPFTPKYYEWYLPFMPHAIEQFNLSQFDVVISSSSTFAKGAIAGPNSKHICYCHSPTRFLWEERHNYVKELSHTGFIKKPLPYYLHKLRQWDVLAANRPDNLLTNSKTSQQRIKRYYRRDAEILYPPVDIKHIQPGKGLGTFWLAGGRLVAYKKFDLVVKAFSKLNLPLKIFGDGPEMKKLKTLAGPKTEFLGRVTEQQKIELYQNAIAYLYPQIEDFGITAVEAMAAGKPVIAYGQGGATESVVPGKTGHFMEFQCWEDIGNAVIRFNPSAFDPIAIRARAEEFSQQQFEQRFKRMLHEYGCSV